MNDYVIVMDVSGDIVEEMSVKMGLTYLPMDYSLGKDMLTASGIVDKDTLKRFYDGQRHGDLTKTTQITPFMFEEHISPFLEEGLDVIYLGLSKGLSKTYESALLAKKQLKEKYPNNDFYVVDTKTTTGGLGVLCERAYRNKEDGMSAIDNFNDLNETANHINTWFMVNDLNYLKRGGRISATTAAFGSMLNIKPILRIAPNGTLETISKKHGDKKALKHIFLIVKDDLEEEKENVVYICDSDARENAIFLEDMLKEKFPNITVRHQTLNPIIGAHTGPGMVAISYYGKKLD